MVTSSSSSHPKQHLFPEYDVLDHISHIFSESLSSGDNNDQDEDLRKGQIEIQIHTDTDKDKYKVFFKSREIKDL